MALNPVVSRGRRTCSTSKMSGDPLSSSGTMTEIGLRRIDVDHVEGPAALGAFREQEYFGSKLPVDLTREFISLNRQPSRLEGKFHFAVSYRFATEGRLEEPEVSLAPPITVAYARPVQAPSILDRLAFSRVARSLRNDHALLYVEVLRPDGTGAGFLVWCRRQEQRWTLFDTEVAWTIQPQLEPEEGPLLAP